MSFPALLRQLSTTGIPRIRFMTSHPKDLSDDLIAAMAECPAVCPHIHMPVQSGSDRLLAVMNRKYTKADYLLLVEKLRARIPHIAITTDIIVGFPGETEADFAETLQLAQDVCFDSAFTFLYSPRPGTPAADMVEQVPEAIKKQRFDRLLAVVNACSLRCSQACVGSMQQVLVEGVSDKHPELVFGRSATHKTVLFPGNSDLTGRIVTVTIKEANTWSLLGMQLKR